MHVTELDKAKELLTIDEGSLDQECLKHPRRMLRWVLLEADARQEVSLAKARMELTEARLKRLIRADPAVHGLKDKPTEGAINEALTEESRYQEDLAAYNGAKHHQDQVAGVVSALTEKRRAIERLVELRQIDYYAEPRPKVGSDAMQQGVKRAARGPVDWNGE